MRENFTLIQKHGSDRWTVALDTTAPRRSHRKFVKDLRLAKSDPEIGAVATVVPTRVYRINRSATRKPAPAPPPQKKAAMTFGQRMAAAKAARLAKAKGGA